MRANRLVVLVLVCLTSLPLFAQQLEIHYINVGWGDSVFIKGPDGTTVLLEAGNTGKGTNYVVPYLKSIGVMPANGLDYMIGGHQHCDHIGGLDEVINAGYDVHIKQYYNGSSYSSSCATEWASAAATTTAGAPVPMPVGTVIPLGNGAKITCVARAGQIIGGGSVSVSDENDLSIALLVQYGGFDYLWASDLGGGSDDGSCTGRSTSQVNVETAVVQAISPGGAAPMISTGGIDVLHVNHHGSESSTNHDWMDYADPDVAVIATGDGQSQTWQFPRIDVVEHVLLAQASCVTAPPTLVLQTEEGNPTGSKTSYAGYCVGDVKITTDGLSIFTVSADGNVTEGPNEVAAAGLPRSFTLDDSGGGGSSDTQAPTVSITSPSNGATVSGTTPVTVNASDNVGVTSVQFLVDGAIAGSSTTAPFTWNWDTGTVANGSHTLMAKAFDAAGNSGTSSTVTVTVSNSGDVQAPSAPANARVYADGRKRNDLYWDPSTDNVGVAGYQVWRASSAGGPFSQIATATATSYTDRDVTSKVTYYYYLKAYDAAGNVSAASNTASVTAK